MNKIIFDTPYTKAWFDEHGELWICHRWSDRVETVAMSLADARKLADAIIRAVQ